jgi:hypothetical protein
MSLFQGSSSHTERKEFEIEGVTAMRVNQYKNKYFKFSHVLFADVFCGAGVNAIDDNVVDGSPVRLLNGYLKSATNHLPFRSGFWFSDIRTEACEKLSKLISARFPKLPNRPQIQAMSAADAINHIGNVLSHTKDAFVFLILDPNGPKDFPKTEVEHLISACSSQIDVIPYISATTINRCLQARNKAGRDFDWWISGIENFDSGFVSALTQNGRKGWVRKPIPGDKFRWTMLPTFGRMPPRNDWGKQGYVDIESEEGRNAINTYCGGVNGQ